MTARASLTLLGVFLFTAGLARAQTTTGSLQGTIRDSSGGALPGVQVTANSPALIQKDLTVYSNQEGFYRLPLLPPGAYTVSYVLQGFRSITRTPLLVDAGQATVVNIQLDVAAVTESVTVEGKSPMIDPTNAKLSFTYNSSVISELPSGRTFSGMMTMIPGVEQGTSGFQDTAQNVLGAGIRGNSYTLDQGNATDPRIQSNMAGYLPYDIVDEVNVLKGGKPAEVGFAFGGYTQVITKSGGNAFHGVTDLRYENQTLEGANLTSSLSALGVTSPNQINHASDASATAGWRFMPDKLWWFGAARQQNLNQNLFGFTQEPQTRTTDGYFWKNTYQTNTRHRLFAGIIYWTDQDNLDSGGGAVIPTNALNAGALRNKDWNGVVVNPRWNGVLSDSLIADFGGTWSRFVINYNEDPTARVGQVDLVTGKRADDPGGIGKRVNPSYNEEVNGSLSWFVPNMAGRHQFKFGGNFTTTRVPGQFSQIGDHEDIFNSGVPAQVRILNTPVSVELDEHLAAAYLQDSWTIKTLTLNLGIRYDRTDAFSLDSQQGGGSFANTALATQYPTLNAHVVPGRHLFAFNNAAPRLSVAWALDSLSTVKASYARYYHFLQSQFLPGTGVGEVTNLVFAWNDLNHDGKYELGEEGRLISKTGGTGAGTTVDPNLRQPHSDEVVVGYSRQVGADVSISANFIYRRETYLTNFLNTAVPFGTFHPVQTPDPITGQMLTVFSQDPSTLGQSALVLTNPAGDDRTYKGLELIANKRVSKAWQLTASFVGSQMIVRSPASSAGQGDTFQDPNMFLNTLGRDPDNLPYQFKVQGTYFAPYSIVVSAFVKYGAGQPITRQLVVRGLPQGTITVFAEVRGTSQLPKSHELDLQVEKAFVVSKAKARISAVFEAFNLTNASTILGEGTRTGVDLGNPTLIANPFQARVGVRIGW